MRLLMYANQYMNNSKIWVIMLFALLSTFIATIILIITHTLPISISAFFLITTTIALISLLSME